MISRASIEHLQKNKKGRIVCCNWTTLPPFCPIEPWWQITCNLVVWSLSMIFRDRKDAGRVLASLLTRYADRDDALVLGLPRGGVPVAEEVARELRIPLDIFVVRKLPVPRCDELAMGAVASGGIRYINQDIVETLDIDSETIEMIVQREEMELRRQELLYRSERPSPDVRDQTVILVDDGLATGSSVRAAIAALRLQKPARIIVGAPAGEPNACKEIAREADETICAAMPESFQAVGQWYLDFSQTTDHEVRRLLARAWKRELQERARAPVNLSIPISGQETIQGELTVFEGARGAVIFAHGSGSSRHSPRNKYVADTLNHAGLATLLIDLLTEDEEIADIRTSQHRFDIDLLTDRLLIATEWLRQHRTLAGAPIGYYGASTGAAAALAAAAEIPHLIDAVVSRGGRPDLAGNALSRVMAPTLFIVGERDEEVLALNSRAAMSMRAETRIEVIPHATHLFEEPGALHRVASLARDWFERTLIRSRAA
jgi:putative phosphoribosyl transferase